MEALKNENIKLIGIHGMGGVGKMTLVKEVGKQAKEKKLFDEVVIALVSQYINIREIQGRLADMLGLKLVEENVSVRAGRLFARIKGVKKILIILDDVWDSFDAMEVGIPFRHKGCKIVITTRRLDVCRTMSTSERTQIVCLDVLTKAESWDLFKKNAGEVVENPTFNDVAREIAEECGGLPVAIVTVGSAMKGREDPEDWKEAARDLRISVPKIIEGVEENVFKCIKFSYDYVHDEEAKRCFLLCSLFPEDRNILIETLVRYAVGLGIVKKVDIIQDVRRRVRLLIKNLKDSCLLIAGEKEDCIKMHDVVRDVALSIGSEEYFVRAGVGFVGLNEWPTKGILDHHTSASLMENQIPEHPSNFSGKTNLKILLLQGNMCLWKNPFFEGMMKALRVLDLSYGRAGPGVLDWGILTCLQTLVLDGNEFLNTCALGQIQTLVVLSLRECSFEESPTSIRNLTNLKLLDMSRCRGDIVFQSNSIACLSRLEELYLETTIARWEFGNELKSLCHLKVFTLQVSSKNPEHLPEDFVFPSNLESFTIHTEYRSPISIWGPNHLVLFNSNRGTIWWLNCVKALLKRTHHLQVGSFSGARNIIPNISDLDVLESLAVDGCDELEYLINEHEDPNPKALSKLERLFLSNLRSLRGLYDGSTLPPVISLSKLRNLSISHCNNLSVAISPFNLLQRLKELEILKITSCNEMREIVADENNGDALDHKIVFKSLKEITLRHLPNLDGFCMGSFPFEFPSLEQVDIGCCPKMKTFTAGVSVLTAITQTPKLKEIELDGVLIMLQGVDLNTVLQNQFKAKEMECASQGSN